MNHQTSDEKLAEIFDVEPVDEKPLVPTSTNIVKMDNQDADLEYVRSNLYDLIDKGGSAITNALQVANESQHPRAYEVAGNLIRNIGDLTDKLVALQKAKAELQPKEEMPNSINIEKAVFVGSTAELLKRVKDGSKE